MNYFINYCSPYITGIPSVYEMIKSKPYSDIQQCMQQAEYLYYKGCKYVQIIDENGSIYSEYEH